MPSWARTDEIFSTRPPLPAAIIGFTAACVATSVLRRLSSMIQSQASRGYSSALKMTLPAPPPTAFTMMSSRPNRSSVTATASAISASLVASPGAAIASQPDAAILSATPCARSAVRSPIATRAPAAPSACPIAEPIAPAPPDTNATRPSRLKAVPGFMVSSLTAAGFGQDYVPNGRHELMVGSDEAAQRPDGGAIGVELIGRHAVGLVRAPEIGNPAQLAEHRGLDRHIDARDRDDAAGVEAELPRVRDRHAQVPADKLGPVQVVTVRRGEQPAAVAALGEDGVSAFGDGQPGPVERSRIDRETITIDHYLQPVVEPAHHDPRDRGQSGGVTAGPSQPVEPALHRLSGRDRLAQRERDRRGGVDAAARCLLDGCQAAGRHRELDVDVRGEPGEPHALLDHARRVAVVRRVRLDRLPALPGVLALKHGQQRRRAAG